MAEFPHTRGDSFFATGQFETSESLTGWTGRAHIRAQPDGPLVDSFQFTWVDAATGRYSLQKLDTRNWPIADLLFDVEIKHPSNGRVHSTSVHRIKTALDISHD